MEVVILLMTHLVEFVPNKTKDVNLSIFDIITRINESKKLKCKFDGRKCNLNQKWNNDKC